MATCQMSAFSGQLPIELREGKKAAARFINSPALARRAVSLGDAQTSVQHPAKHDPRDLFPRGAIRDQRESGADLSLALDPGGYWKRHSAGVACSLGIPDLAEAACLPKSRKARDPAPAHTV
ncbi:MAG: hypothetical protein EKK29_07790 [Hyphomicrobiales bacterium]|nr:MAG: hypothetical protein EKK29_07790 [Hyphomicrobiales bacterium]